MFKRILERLRRLIRRFRGISEEEERKPERFLLLYHGRQAICPGCAGLLMTPEPMKKHCIDCHKDYICVGFGMADNELIYEEVLKDGET